MSYPCPTRILVVDDEAEVRQRIMRILGSQGFECDAAHCGSSALEMALHEAYEVVVTDLRMEGGNGHQLAIDLLSMPNAPAVIIITGVFEPRLVNDLRLRGVDDVLLKPFHDELLVEQVHSALRRRLERSTVGRHEVNSEYRAATAAALPISVPDHPKSHVPSEQHQQSSVDTFVVRSSEGKGTAAPTAPDVGSSTMVSDGLERHLVEVRCTSESANGNPIALRHPPYEGNGPFNCGTMRIVSIFCIGIAVGWLVAWLGVVLARLTLV